MLAPLAFDVLWGFVCLGPKQIWPSDVICLDSVYWHIVELLLIVFWRCLLQARKLYGDITGYVTGCDDIVFTVLLELL